DKTGTLTHDHLVLQEVRTRTGTTREEALQLAAGLAEASLHPVSRALALAAKTDCASSLPRPLWTSISEIAGQGMQGNTEGGLEVRLGSSAFCGVQVEPISDPGNPRAHLSDQAGWVATFELQEGLRSDARAAVQTLRDMGIGTWLLSGDKEGAARLVGQAVGVDHVIAGASPERKLAEVIALQAKGVRIAMVGDGLNDGPVLARADTSFALGHAAPLAQAQSDYVIQGGQVMDVVRTLQQARATMRTVRQNLVWAGVYNAISVPMALVGWMPPWLAGLGMAASSLLVIGNALRLARNPVSGRPPNILTPETT
ncbi:MAG: heavy metal translocating P-type ATPase, partial [Comamonadaceae bacterium]|nr:heavy metal translocating P-type ATPase [Comamonadaceae bacterium]